MDVYEIISNHVSYDPFTGEFLRTKAFNDRLNHLWRIGDRIGNLTSNGYLEISVGDWKISSHKLAYYIIYGEKEGVIDHINGDKTDNRISNLRLVTNSTNQRNRKKNVNNTTGYTSISINKSGTFRVRIKIDGKLIGFGSYASIDDAIIARDKVYNENGFTERHGNET